MDGKTKALTFLMCSHIAKTFGSTIVLGILIKEISLYHGISIFNLTQVITFSILFNSAVLPYFGKIIEKHYTSKYLNLVPLLMVICLGGIFLGKNIYILITSLLLLRFIINVYIIIIEGKIIQLYFYERKGRVLAFLKMFMAFIKSFWPLILAYMLRNFPFFYSALPCVILILPFCFLSFSLFREIPKQEKKEVDEVCKIPLLYYVQFSVHGFIPFVISGFFLQQDIITDALNLPENSIGAFAFLFVIFELLFSSILGFIVDKIGSIRIYPLIFITIFLMIISLRFTSDFLGIKLFLCALGLASGVCSIIVPSYIMEKVDQKFFLQFKAMNDRFCRIGVALGPICFHYLIT